MHQAPPEVPSFPPWPDDLQSPHPKDDGEETTSIRHAATVEEKRLRGDQIRVADHESEPGHAYRLARKLQDEDGPAWDTGDEAPHISFPDVRIVPVPDVFLGQLDALSGAAIRCAILLIRKAYQKRGDTWVCSGRYWSARELAGDEGLGICQESLRRGMRELKSRGWVRIKGERSLSYRWMIGVPEHRFTPIPLAIICGHIEVSPSALTLLLAIYRCTWGWTETRSTDAGEAVTVHRCHEQLSLAELRGLTGLTGPTVRAAKDELRKKKAICRDRPRDGVAFFWRPSRSFIRESAQKFLGGTSRDRISNNTRARKADDARNTGELTKGKRRSVSAPKSRGDLSEEWKRQFFDVWTEEIGMKEEVALHYLHVRGNKSLHESTLRAVRRKSPDLNSPAGYAHTALENLWHSSIENKQPKIHESDNQGNPIANVFKQLAQEREKEGWEWDDEEEETDEGPSMADVAQRVGITHGELKQAVNALDQPPGDWETRGEKPPLFVPNKTLARWAWHHRGELDEEGNRWAERLVQVRAKVDDVDL